MYNVILKKGEEKRLIAGHLWIYANEVSKIVGKDTQGSICKVLSFDERFIGLGYINHHSKIIVRLLTNKEEEINRDFFLKRISDANQRRIALGYQNNYRVVFGESDLLPGLIVDKYGDCIVIQTLTLGIDIRKDMIVEILVELFKPKTIYERSDVAVREKEGLKQTKGLLYGEECQYVEIVENNLLLDIDIINGQKTGYFLDQKENRANLKQYVKDRDVLDCFCNIGGFSLCAASFGARSVKAIDISDYAIELLQRNAKKNNLEIETYTTDVFQALRDFRHQGQTFDCIILDPPAFTKSFDTVKAGFRGYCDINIQALKLIRKGGFLFTCSCSQHLTINLFLEMIKTSINNANVQAQLVELRIQGKDHATLLNLDESLYLKMAVIRVL